MIFSLCIDFSFITCITKFDSATVRPIYVFLPPSLSIRIYRFFKKQNNLWVNWNLPLEMDQFRLCSSRRGWCWWAHRAGDHTSKWLGEEVKISQQTWLLLRTLQWDEDSSLSLQHIVFKNKKKRQRVHLFALYYIGVDYIQIYVINS